MADLQLARLTIALQRQIEAEGGMTGWKLSAPIPVFRRQIYSEVVTWCVSRLASDGCSKAVRSSDECNQTLNLSIDYNSHVFSLDFAGLVCRSILPRYLYKAGICITFWRHNPCFAYCQKSASRCVHVVACSLSQPLCLNFQPENFACTASTHFDMLS